MTTIEIIALAASFLLGLVGSKAYTFIGNFALKGSKVSVQLSEAFAASAKTFDVIDEAIKNDGKIDANELKELIAKGKDTIVEFKDVIVEIKKK